MRINNGVFMSDSIRRFTPDAEYFFEEGCFINELSNRADDPQASIAQARVRPGDTTRWHSLAGITERYVILQGEGVVEVGDEPARKVAAGDVVIIAPGERQRIHNPAAVHNTGAADLIFLAICTPRFVPEAYQDLED